MPTLAWPATLRVASEHWRIGNASRSGGVSITGGEQVVAAGAGRWMATLSVPIAGNVQVMAARALLAGLDGRANSVAMGPFELGRVPWATDAQGRLVTPRTAGERRPRLDATPFADAGFVAIAQSQVHVTLAQAAPLNATAVAITIGAGGPVGAGQMIGLGGRLYMVTDITGSACTIRPGLRAAAAAGDAVELVQPTCPMRMASDDTGAMDLEMSRRGTLSLELVEAF